MRVYCSGPMRGLPNHNYAEFKRVGELLNERGYDVLNPMGTRLGPNAPRAEYLREDVTMMLIADAVVVLSGWENSPGARLEVALGWSFELPTFRFVEHKSDWFLVPMAEGAVSIPSERNKHPLIGLCGYARSGKDTFANALTDAGEWSRVAFADPLKELAYSIGWSGKKDDEGRVLLQDLGVGVRKHLFTDLWVQKAEETIDHLNNPVVITDVRFPNELEMVRRRGGLLIWISRQGIGPANSHVSEHSVTAADCHYGYSNDKSLDQVAKEVPSLVEDLVRDHIG